MRMLLGLCCLGFSVLLTTAAAHAEEKKDVTATHRSRPEEDAIRATSKAFETAFNKHDAKAVAALWTEDGDYHDEDGVVHQGRKAIEQEYARFFADAKSSKIRVMVDSVRLLSDTAAIEDGRAIASTDNGAPAMSKYSVVHVKVDGKWLMSTVRDTRIEIPSTYAQLEDFEWLIGKWFAEERGTKTEYECRWVANKSFIERKYLVTHADQTVTGGIQFIGWNAQAGHVQSWNFASDGGHSVGIWQPHENGWGAEVRGMTGQGVSTSAFNIFTKLDDNACTWQSVQRRVGDQTLPDTDEVVIKRQTSK